MAESEKIDAHEIIESTGRGLAKEIYNARRKDWGSSELNAAAMQSHSATEDAIRKVLAWGIVDAAAKHQSSAKYEQSHLEHERVSRAKAARTAADQLLREFY